MPGMDGFETATLIRNRAIAAHPIIFLTAFSTIWCSEGIPWARWTTCSTDSARNIDIEGGGVC